MTGGNKILTVSYGTFSCTLEGFDEPFTTMKAIAEYFRDLAADDRYFGAEPPTPDAEMLHRIAEREIQRRVEAKISENTVVLRQTQAPAPAEPVAEPVAPAAAATPVTPAPVAPAPVAPAPVQPAAAAAAPAMPAEAAPADSISDKLARIRAVVATPVAAAAAEPAYYEDLADDAGLTQDQPEPVALDEDFGFELDMGDADLPEVLVLGAVDRAIETAEAAAEPPAPVAEIAAAEDQVRDATLDDLQAVLAASAESPTEDWEVDAESLRSAQADDAAADAASLPEDTEAAIAEAEMPVAAEAGDNSVWESYEEAAQTATGDAAAAETMADAEDDDDEAPASPLANLIAQTRARVLTVKASDRHTPRPLAEDLGAEPVAAEPEAEAPAEAAEAGDESVIAGIEAAIGAIDERGEDDAGSLEPSRAPAGKTILHEDAEEGTEFDRLMDEANNKLEGVESRRRFSAISHLKAAVAATVADRMLKSQDAPADEGAEEEPEIDRYRDDLSRAVRPRRPEPESERVTARPAMPMRPAPLVLVSEQRVDRPEQPLEGGVRPRRVAASAYSLGEDDDLQDLEPLSPEEARSFSEFAERLGARSLADLLEAAAVYIATVEGKNSFSRPNLLRRVNAASNAEDYSREDYLRSFGSLLRQGKIQKVERGRFSVTESSPFMSEMRRAAN